MDRADKAIDVTMKGLSATIGVVLLGVIGVGASVGGPTGVGMAAVGCALWVPTFFFLIAAFHPRD